MMTTATPQIDEMQSATEAKSLPESKRDRVFAAIDALDGRRAEWQNSPELAPADEFWNAFDDLVIELADGEVEPEFRDVYRAAIAMVEEKQAGERAFDPLPRHAVVGNRFWRHFDRLMEARRGELMPSTPPKQVEPIATLVAQNLSHNQIARVYGYRDEAGKWCGPFFNQFGNTQIDLIKQEISQPGSVLGENWVHPESVKRKDEIEREQTAFIDTRSLVPEARLIEHRRSQELQAVPEASGLPTQF